MSTWRSSSTSTAAPPVSSRSRTSSRRSSARSSTSTTRRSLSSSRSTTNTIRVDAKMPIDEVNELLEVELPHEEWDTVGGLVFGLTGRVPVAGETVTFDSLEFKTERVTGRRIQKVVIRKVGREPAAGESDRVSDTEPFRSGFVAVVGRPNVGKSTLRQRARSATRSRSRPTSPRRRGSAIRGHPRYDPARRSSSSTRPAITSRRTLLGQRLNDVVREPRGPTSTWRSSWSTASPGSVGATRRLRRDLRGGRTPDVLRRQQDRSR